MPEGPKETVWDYPNRSGSGEGGKADSGPAPYRCAGLRTAGKGGRRKRLQAGPVVFGNNRKNHTLYLIERRLEHAALLLTEQKNVSQAAALSGYSNMSHFSASFKKKYGVLPKEYAGK